MKYRDQEYNLEFSEYHTPLWLSFWISEPFARKFQKICGSDYDNVQVVKNNFISGWVSKSAMDKIFFSAKNKISVDWADSMLSDFDIHLKKILGIIDSLSKIEHISRDKVLPMLKELRLELCEIYPYSNFGYLFSKELENLIITKIKVLFPDKNSGEVLSQMMHPARPTLLQNYSSELKQIADHLRDFGLSSVVEIKDFYNKNEEFKKKIDQFVSRYFFMTGLNAGIRSVDSFLPEISSAILNKSKEIKKIEIPEALKDEMSVLNAIFYFKDDCSTYIIPYLRFFLDNFWIKLSESFGISVNDLEQLSFEELLFFLENPISSHSLLKICEDHRICTVFYHKSFGETDLFFGEGGLKEVASFIIEDMSQGSEVFEIFGKIGSVGKVSGIVQVILNHDEFYKFKEGNILVTIYTAPDFVPIMQKSKAIVTDTGGIVSHAAIVSRELKKPCIVGTKIATKVLKDGDLVEVNADEGVVKILKKADGN